MKTNFVEPCPNSCPVSGAPAPEGPPPKPVKAHRGSSSGNPYTIEALPGGRRWRVFGYRPGGERVRKRKFKNWQEACDYRDQLVQEDLQLEGRMALRQTELGVEVLRDAEIAYRDMLHLPAPDWDQEGPWTFRQLVAYVKEHYKPVRNPKRFSEALPDYQKYKEACDRCPTTLSRHKSMLHRLLRAHPGIQVHEVTATMLLPLVKRGRHYRTWVSNLKLYSAFFEWALNPERGYCGHNPTLGVNLPEKSDPSPVPQIMDVKRAKRLLQLAQDYEGGCLFLYVVLGTVLALRPAEMARMEAVRQTFGGDALEILHEQPIQFGAVGDPGHLYVMGKCRTRRTVPIPPEWANLIRPYVEAGFPFVPRYFVRRWRKLRKLVGFYIGKDIASGSTCKSESTERKVKYQPDLMRHTGISYKLAYTGNESETALTSGNSPDVIHGNYKERSTQADARLFFELEKYLRHPTREELVASGIPAKASRPDLQSLGVVSTHHTTYFLTKEGFASALAIRQGILGYDPLLIWQDARPKVEVVSSIPTKGGRPPTLHWPPNEELRQLKDQFTGDEIAARLHCSKSSLYRRLRKENI